MFILHISENYRRWLSLFGRYRPVLAVLLAGTLLLAIPAAQATAILYAPIRITTNIGNSKYPSIAASGIDVYVAWQDDTPVPGSGTAEEIWMRASSNNGGSFGSAIRISTNTGISENPSVAASGNHVYVAWDDDTIVPGSGTCGILPPSCPAEIWMRVSSNNGANFGSPIRISTNVAQSEKPSVAAVDNYVYVAWDDWTSVPGSGSYGYPEIWMRVSNNNGASFGSAIRISTNAGHSENPSVAATGSYVYVAWHDDTFVTGSGGNSEIWMRASSNNGGSFGPAVRISTNTGISWNPSLAASGTAVYVAWQDDTQVTGSGTQPEIWMRVSSNHGASFGSAIRMSSNAAISARPSVAAGGDYVCVAWDDYTPVPGSGSGSNSEVWMRVSSNRGGAFDSATRVTTNTGYSGDSSVAVVPGVDTTTAYIAWMDDTQVPGSGVKLEIWFRVGCIGGDCVVP